MKKVPGISRSDLRTCAAYTTNEAAALSGISQNALIRAFDGGTLGGFRIPGSRHRRIPRPHLVRFMRGQGIPLGVLECVTGPVRVLCFGSRPPLGDDFSVTAVTDVVAAGRAYTLSAFLFCVVDASCPDAFRICAEIRAMPALRRPFVIVFHGAGADASPFLPVCDHLFPLPFHGSPDFENFIRATARERFHVVLCR